MSWLYGRREEKAFHDKAWKRADMAAWDERWAGLSLAARRRFVEDVKPGMQGRRAPGTPASRFSAAVLEEMTAAGLIEIDRRWGKPEVVVSDAARGFASRLRALNRYRLLDGARNAEFANYVGYCFQSYELDRVLFAVIGKATGLPGYSIVGDLLEVLVARRRWPEWVLAYLNDPLAGEVLQAVRAAGGRLPLAGLAERLPAQDPAAVRPALDRLVNHLALVEDLDQETYEILVGLLPSVRADLHRQRRPRPRLAVRPAPADVSPEGGIDVPDLRSLLLELAGGRARLRKDRTLFEKERDRFLGVMEPLPGWLQERVGSPGDRLDKAARWARVLELVRELRAAGALLLDLTDEGRRWLGLGFTQQYAFLYAYVRDLPRDQEQVAADLAFLGSRITSVPVPPKATGEPDYGWHIHRSQREPLRRAVHRAFSLLPEGEFVTVASFLDHAAYGEHNPLYLGTSAERVRVRNEGRLILPLEEQLEELGRRLLKAALERLVVFGCAQLGREPGGALVVARRPRLEAYFEAGAPAVAPGADVSRVIVQPDFTIVVIGLAAGPSAELAPFCDRVQGSAGQGSLTFRLSRESVQKGLAAGLEPAEVFGRLERLSSTPLPQNVAAQLRTWCDWVRKVSAGPATLIRCPDEAAAERVLAALGKSAERLGERLVAWPGGGGLNAALRRKLQEQGIVVEVEQASRER